MILWFSTRLGLAKRAFSKCHSRLVALYSRNVFMTNGSHQQCLSFKDVLNLTYYLFQDIDVSIIAIPYLPRVLNCALCRIVNSELVDLSPKQINILKLHSSWITERHGEKESEKLLFNKQQGRKICPPIHAHQRMTKCKFKVLKTLEVQRETVMWIVHFAIGNL